MIATAPIPADTILIHTPKSLVVPHSDEQCRNVQLIIDELKLGTKSKWYPYFEFDDSSGSRLPTQWDGIATRELQGLPPSGETHRHIIWYQGTCKNGNEMTDLDWRGLLMFLTRASDIGLVPMYSLLNHHNGLINTKLQRDDRGGLAVIALTDISANEPIYLTYARSGTESTIDIFNTYGFVEDYPQLWRWSDEKLVRLLQGDHGHAYDRYGVSYPDLHPDDRSHFQPNNEQYEILVISPTLAALSPTKHLVATLGNAQRTLQEWAKLITVHHINLRYSHANTIHDSAMAMLNKLPTTIEEDEMLVWNKKMRLDKLQQMEGGRVDVNEADVIQAIEYRLAFKKALRMAVEVAGRAKFLAASEEL